MGYLCQQARYGGLLVVGQADPADREEGGLLLDLPAYVVLHCGRPVLLVPSAGRFDCIGQRPLPAWNGWLEAAKAGSAALPLLQRAQEVTLGVCGDMDHAGEAGTDMALYLARHGVKVQVQRPPHPAEAGHAILSLAQRPRVRSAGDGLRPERERDGIGQHIEAGAQPASRIVMEQHVLGWHRGHPRC